MKVEKFNIPVKSIIVVAAVVIGGISSVYTVNEGHIGIVKTL